MADAAIEVVDAVKVYRVYRHPLDRVWHLITGAPRGTEVHALRGVSLAVPRGVTYGVIGRNGSGKSTLLQVLAGTVTLTSGRAEAHGRVSAVLELGAGFSPEFSGIENAYIGGLLGGVSRREMTQRMPALRAFADIGAAFDRPMKTYSSGMITRLAFATAISVEPEVLLIDEVLAVGDAFFQQRCMRRIRELQVSGVTIVLVTHDYNAVTNLCARAAWLDEGRVMAEGEPGRVVREYLGSRTAGETGGGDVWLPATPAQPLPADDVPPVFEVPHVDHRHGNGDGQILGIGLDVDGAVRPGRRCRVRITARAQRTVRSPILGFTMRNRLGDIVTATNTMYEGIIVPSLMAGDTLTTGFEFTWPTLAAGPYSFSPALADGDLEQHHFCDWIDNALVIETVDPGGRYGWMRLPGVRVQVALKHGETEPAVQSRA